MTATTDRTPQGGSGRVTDVDVLIAGAGPVGLTMAIELSRLGIPFRIIDKVLPRRLEESRATAIHTRTFELWSRYGVIDEMVARGVRLNGVSAYSKGRRLGRAIVEGVDSPYGFSVMFPQSETERILIEHLEQLGTKVERPVELVSFARDDSGVDVVVRENDGSEQRLRVAYLLGCDGGHSTVRKLLGYEFEGKEFRGSFLMDCKVDWPKGGFEDGGQNYLSRGKDMILWQNPDGWTRVVVALPKSDPRMVVHPPTLEEMQAFADEEPGLDVRLHDPRWTTSFYSSNRMVEHWRAGRVFLVGDAAHIHDPTGGQGMNVGVLDAVNLSWKLALDDKGYGAGALLDSYQIERKHNVKVLLRTIERTAGILTAKYRLTAVARLKLIGVLTSYAGPVDLGRRSLAGFKVTYRKSPIVSEHRTTFLRNLVRRARGREPVPFTARGMFRRFGPGPGERAFDATEMLDPRGDAKTLHQIIGSDPRHQLLVFQGITTTDERVGELRELVREANRRYPEIMRALLVAPRPAVPDAEVIVDQWYRALWRYGAKTDCLYLVRPDGYVGFRSQPATIGPLDRYVTQVFPRVRA